MDTATLLRSFPSRSPLLLFSVLPRPAATNLSFSPHHRRYQLRVRATDGAEGSGNDGTRPTRQAPPSLTPPETVEIRFRRGSRSRRQKQQMEEGGRSMKVPKEEEPVPPKKWEEMSLGEKATELYVGEKGLLFWLNKFAYASIFIMIGAWIMFRFVGPALNLYQLDSNPLPPTSIFKG
ncbi:hypothetical protein SAY87_020066 [Trapa incisa]|uniref:Uncharacterized protein n=1 Tax=Trapa incisa TaxID=236973 RepID=A0AAN7Q886_9MYRT|nr:hypothetical protein SAY87_020066 [Trapa incisa]